MRESDRLAYIVGSSHIGRVKASIAVKVAIFVPFLRMLQIATLHVLSLWLHDICSSVVERKEIEDIRVV